MRRAGLLLLLATCFSGCATAGSDPARLCPPWPPAGAEVAGELERSCLPEARCPALWGWLQRLDRLKRQLDACRA